MIGLICGALQLISVPAAGLNLSVLEGAKYALRLGYVAVKNPNRREMMAGRNYEQTRALELSKSRRRRGARYSDLATIKNILL